MLAFNPINLARGFERLLENHEYRTPIENDITRALKNRSELDRNPDFIGAIEKLGGLITSRNYYREKAAKNFEMDFEKKIKPLGSGFLKTEKGQRSLIDIVIKNAQPKKKDSEKAIRDLLAKLESMSVKEWTYQLYDLSREEKNDVLGEKGRDLYLRDMGFFDRIPIDVHEMRFIIRTGIFYYGPRASFDLQEKKDFRDALVNFCNKYLTNLKVCDSDLSKNPGIVDLIIWYHCADSPGFSVCAKEPKCLKTKNICPFSEACLFHIAHFFLDSCVSPLTE